MRVYRYFLKPYSAQDDKEVHRQLKLAGDYRRALAMIENGERAAVGALYLEDPAIRDRTAALTAAFAAHEKDETAINQLKAELHALRVARGKTPAHREALVKIRERRGPMVRGVRGHFSAAGLFWGTYLLVEDAHDRAVRSLPPWEQLTVRGPWESMGVQIQSTKRMTGAGLRSGTDTRARITEAHYALAKQYWTDDGEPVYDFYGTPSQDAVDRVGNRKGRRFQTLSIRTGTVPGKQAPIWTRFHILTKGRGKCRQIPDDASIAWIKVVRTHVTHRPRIGRGTPTMAARERWEVQFTVTEPIQRTAPTATGAVGIDIGWRRVDGGIRVAYAATKTGAQELVIPDSLLALRGKADSIRSYRDLQLDQLRNALIARRETAPADLAEVLAHAHSWRRVGHFVHVARRIHEVVHAGRPDVINWLDPWFVVAMFGVLKRDGHLRDYEAGLRDQQQRRILGRTQTWIAGVLAGHDVVGIEQTIRIDRMRARNTADAERARQAAVAHVETAPGRLREWVIKMAESRGITVREIDPYMTTRRCDACGEDRGPCTELYAVCPHCGFAEDQDYTAAKTIRKLASGELSPLRVTPLASTDSDTSPKSKTFRRNRKAPKQEVLATEPTNT